VVDGTGDQFLSGTRLSQYEDWSICRGHLFDLKKQIFEGVTLSDNIRKLVFLFDDLA
jgi:hypothetical protein